MTTAAPISTPPKFRLAIVGAGLITRNTHLPTALSLPEVEVRAIVDPVGERARELLREYGLDAAQAHSDVRAVVGEVDGAIVATPNHTHREAAVPLLEAGISTLIEKPLATSVEDGQAILDAAERGHARVAIGHYQRFLDAPRLLDALLRQQYFGRVTRFVHQYGSAGGWPSMSSYTLQRDAIGGGVLVVTGTHFIDRMLHTWGMPDEVALFDDAAEGPESHCEGHIRYTTGPHAPLEGVVRYSKVASLAAGLVLETERGTVLLRDSEHAPVTWMPHDNPELRAQIVAGPGVTLDPALDSSQRMLRDFVSACRERCTPEVDGSQGLTSLVLLKRFYGSRRRLPGDWTRDEVTA